MALAVGLYFAVPWGRRVYANALVLKSMGSELRTLRAAGLKPETLPVALDLARRANATNAALRADLAPLFPYLPRLGKLPRYGPYLLAVEPGLNYIDSLTR